MSECAACGEDSGLVRCARCRITPYCSEACGKQDWEKHCKICCEPEAISFPGVEDAETLVVPPPREQPEAELAAELRGQLERYHWEPETEPGIEMDDAVKNKKDTRCAERFYGSNDEWMDADQNDTQPIGNRDHHAMMMMGEGPRGTTRYTLYGNGRKAIEATRVHIRVQIRTQDRSAKMARERNIENHTTMIRQLDAAVAVKNAFRQDDSSAPQLAYEQKDSSYSLRELFTYPRNAPPISEGYEITHSTTLCINDPKEAGFIVDAVTSSTNVSVPRVEFRVTFKEEQAISGDVVSQAMQNALQKSNAIRDTFNASSHERPRRLLYVKELGNNTRWHTLQSRSLEAVRSESPTMRTSIDPGQIVITARVEIGLEMTDYFSIINGR